MCYPSQAPTGLPSFSCSPSACKPAREQHFPGEKQPLSAAAARRAVPPPTHRPSRPAYSRSAGGATRGPPRSLRPGRGSGSERVRGPGRGAGRVQPGRLRRSRSGGAPAEPRAESGAAARLPAPPGKGAGSAHPAADFAASTRLGHGRPESRPPPRSKRLPAEPGARGGGRGAARPEQTPGPLERRPAQEEAAGPRGRRRPNGHPDGAPAALTRRTW